jgi:deazaflavin-dependent oxidoreductase (nitroreductase family)
VGIYQSVGKRIGKTRAFAEFSKRVLPPIDRVLSRVTNGKTIAGTILPTFIVVHRGAKSGKEYRTPLSYIRVGNDFGLAGSNFGQAHHPAWSGNLIANPDAFVELDGQKVPVRARLCEADEKARLWPRFVEIWPAYETYDARSGDRNIRVFVLERK